MAQISATQPMNRIESQPFREGEMTRRMEEQTAKIPSGTFLGLAIGSIAISAGIALFSEKKELATFVGQWAPTLLLIGIYNKLVKQQGSDFQHRSSLQEHK